MLEQKHCQWKLAFYNVAAGYKNKIPVATDYMFLHMPEKSTKKGTDLWALLC